MSVTPESKGENEANSGTPDGTERSPLFYFNPPSSRCTRESEHIRKTERQADGGEGKERERDTSGSSLQTRPKRAGLSGFSCSVSRTPDGCGTHSLLRVSRAHPVEAAKESPRAGGGLREGYTLHMVECFRAESSRKRSFGRAGSKLHEFLAGFRRELVTRASLASIWSDEGLSSNFDEMHYGVMNSRREYARAAAQRR